MKFGTLEGGGIFAAILFLVALIAAILIYRFFLPRMRKGVTADGADPANPKNYQRILDALERSNVLLWWARVNRVGTQYQWKIRTPPAE